MPPAVIGAGIAAAGTIASQAMKNKAESDARKANNANLNTANAANQAYANTMGSRSENEYNYRTGLRGDITNQLWNKYQGAPTTTGGRAAYYDPYQNLRQDVYNQYADLAKTGGWTPEDIQGYRSWTTAPITGFYAGLKNQMARANNATGGYAGYNSQSAGLARDAARQGYLAALQSEGDLQDKIRAAKLQGLSGMASEAERLNAGYHAAVAGSAGGPGTQDYYLKQLMGMMGTAEDLPYAQLQATGLGLGNTNAAVARQAEIPAWQSAVAQYGPSVAGSLVSAISNNNNSNSGGYPGGGPYGGYYSNPNDPSSSPYIVEQQENRNG